MVPRRARPPRREERKRGLEVGRAARREGEDEEEVETSGSGFWGIVFVVVVAILLKFAMAPPP